MMQGIPGYFCVDISCEIPLHPTLNGQKYPPLLTQDKIDQAMRENEAKALRELVVQFAYREICMNNILSNCWEHLKLIYQSKVMKYAQV